MARLLKGGPVVAAQMKKISIQIEQLNKHGIAPGLAIVQIGQREDNLSYERGTAKRAESLGVTVKHISLPESVAENTLIDVLHAVNDDKTVHGRLLFRPLSIHLGTERIANALCLERISTRSFAATYSRLANGTPAGTTAAQRSLTVIRMYSQCFQSTNSSIRPISVRPSSIRRLI